MLGLTRRSIFVEEMPRPPRNRGQSILQGDYAYLMLVAAAGLSEVPSTPAPKPGTPEWEEKLRDVLSRPLPPSAGDVLSRDLRKLHGKRAQVAFDRLDYPDRRMTVQGAVLYIWANDDTNRDGSPLYCTVKVIVRKGLIASTDIGGNEGACATFAHKLDPSFHLF
ncbi:hypothetical protein OKA06_06220 [Novosphingobium sp. MW5]|nr:hypothetical protein [Novosphingobium sp. MW5]